MKHNYSKRKFFSIIFSGFFFLFFLISQIEAKAQCKPGKGTVAPVVAIKNASKIEGSLGSIQLLGYKPSKFSDILFPYTWEIREESSTGKILSHGTVDSAFPSKQFNFNLSDLKTGNYYLITCDKNQNQFVNQFLIESDSQLNQSK